MNKISHFILAMCLVLFCSITANAQTKAEDFEKKGDLAVSKGDYADAEIQFQAAMAMMDMAKVDKNSVQYMQLSKKNNAASQCKEWSTSLTKGLEELKTENIIAQFEEVQTEDGIDQVCEKLVKRADALKKKANDILQRFSSDRVTRNQLAQCNQVQEEILNIRNSQEDLIAWINVRDQRSLEAYETFISENPDSKYKSIARDSINAYYEGMAWAALIQSPLTEESLEDYLRSYPNGRHADTARTSLNNFQQIRADENAWNEALLAGTSSSFNQYLRSYPKGLHVSEAKKKKVEADIKEDDLAWKAAEASKQVSVYKDYLKKYPKGRHVEEARQAPARVEDNELWEKYSKSDTKASYKEYLAQSKLKLHETEAKNRITAIEKQERADAAIQRARGLKAAGASASEQVAAYSVADALGALNKEDREDYANAKDEDAYIRFKAEPTTSQAKSYLSSFPKGNHAAEVAEYVAVSKADAFNVFVGDKEYQEALAFARTEQTRSYVTKKYQEMQKEYEKMLKRQKRESFHVIGGVGLELGSSSWDASAIGGQDITKKTALGVKAAFSIGGHSNLFNLELSASYYLNYKKADVVKALPCQFRFAATPKINIIKKPKGEYDNFYLYVGPEVSLDIPSYRSEGAESFPKAQYTFGGRVGVGLSTLEVNIGYHYNTNQQAYYPKTYFTVGAMFYFSKY